MLRCGPKFIKLGVNLFKNLLVIHCEVSRERSIMTNLRRKAQIALVLLVPVFSCACLNLMILDNVKDPTRYFDEAYREINRIHRQYPDREGVPSHVHFLFYDRSDKELVKFEVPLSLVRESMDLGMYVAEKDGEFDFGDRYDFDWSEIRDISLLGKGLLLEVDDEEGKILIWLD
jgi:hypothetical protein